MNKFGFSYENFIELLKENEKKFWRRKWRQWASKRCVNIMLFFNTKI